MKKVYKLLFILTIMLTAFVGVNKVDALGADVVATGTSGDCGWILYEAGDLHIGTHLTDLDDPDEPNTCTLGGPIREENFEMGGYYYVGPWEYYSNDIKEIYFSGTVYANSNSSILFAKLYNLNKINFSNFVTTNATDMSGMFNGCNSLQSVDLSSFDTKNVTDMHAMFSESGFLSLDLSSFDTSKVTDMSAMFSFDTNLQSVNLSSFDTSKVIEMGGMFSLTGLKSLDLSSFDTSKVTGMLTMFGGSSHLEKIIVSDKFTTSSVIIGEDTSEDVFLDCTSLVGGNGTKYDSNKTDVTYAVIDSNSTPGYFTKKLNTYIVQFNTNGGTAINNQGVLEGEKVSSYKTTRDGYKFIGWYKDSNFANEFDFNTPITSNLTLYAKWQKLINISDAKITGIANKTYNGKTQTPNIKLTYNGTLLKKNIDYKLEYKNNKNTGKATITIKGIGNYSGTITKTFRIIPSKAVISKVTKTKKSITIKWNKISTSTGYQVAFRKMGPNKYKYYTVTATSKKFTKLKSKKYHQMKVRAYKVIDGKKYYGAWSIVKKVRTK